MRRCSSPYACRTPGDPRLKLVGSLLTAIAVVPGGGWRYSSVSLRPEGGQRGRVSKAPGLRWMMDRRAASISGPLAGVFLQSPHLQFGPQVDEFEKH